MEEERPASPGAEERLQSRPGPSLGPMLALVTLTAAPDGRLSTAPGCAQSSLPLPETPPHHEGGWEMPPISQMKKLRLKRTHSLTGNHVLPASPGF